MAYNEETGLYEGYIYKIWNEVNDKIYIGQTKDTIKNRWHGHMSAALSEKRGISILYNAIRKYGRNKFHIEEIDKIECKSFEELTVALDNLEVQRIQEYNTNNRNGYNIESGGTGKMKRAPGRTVCKYDDDLNLLETYDSLQEAGRRNNIDGTTIWAVCNHHYTRAAGYVWAYEGEEPIRPLTTDEINQKCIETRLKNKEKNPKPTKSPKIKKERVSRAMDSETKRENRLKRLDWNGKSIIQYNAFGEVINIYNDLIDAIDNIPIKSGELKKNLDGKNLCFNKTILRYEGDAFDLYPMSKQLKPVVLYDLQGNYIQRFECQADAEKYLDVNRGELTKVLKRGGSIKNHLVSEYGKPIDRRLMRQEHVYEMLSDDGEVIRTFNTYKEIDDMFGLSNCGKDVRNAILNNEKYKGYYWRFQEEYPVNIS